MKTKKKNSSFKRLINVSKYCWKLSKGFCVVNIVYYAFSYLLPYISIYFSYLLLDGLIAQASKEYLYTQVFWMISLNLVVGIIIKVLNHFKNVYNSKINVLVDKSITDKTFNMDFVQVEDNENMKKLELARSGSNGSGDLTSFGDMIGACFGALFNIGYSLTLLSGLFISVTTSTSNNFVKFLNNPMSFICLMLYIVLYLGINVFIAKKNNKLSYDTMINNMDSNRAYSYFFDLCDDYKYGKDIRVFKLQRLIMHNLKYNKFISQDSWNKYSNVTIRNNFISGFLEALLLCLSYLYVGMKAYYGLISIGSVVSYVSSITLLSNGVGTIVATLSYLLLMTNYLEKYFEYINIKPEIKYGEKQIDRSKACEIEFKNVSFTYPHQKDVILDDVSFKINTGKKLAIVGQNGAGKTTIIKLLCRFYEPNSGDILINGENIKEYSKDSCYELFSVVFQDFKLFSYSIKDNVASGTNGDETKVLSCLDKAGIKDRVLSFKDGINTMLYNKNSESGVEISGGEAQKIAIARALYKDSPIVVLDEPTSALDPKSEAEIYEKFSTLVNNKTSIFISHRMSSCRFCDDILVLDQGKIVQEGSHKELVKDKNGEYYAMWHAQAKYYE